MILWILGTLGLFVVVSVLIIVGAVIIAAINDYRDMAEYLRNKDGDK